MKIGSSVSDLRVIFGDNLQEEPSGNDTCFYLQSPAHPQLGFMIIENRITRIDVTKPGIKTAAGIQVGDSEANTKAVYQHLVVEPHAYSAPDGHYLTVRSPDGRFVLRFETYKGKVTGFYVGTPETIQYIEGCD